ncbi:hypothetical protein BFR04_16070 [Gaetbulibacter sp. 4G1]|nr:hypothetical protein BFR04_16070 [Gaetbulibacter sp. 4G1]
MCKHYTLFKQRKHKTFNYKSRFSKGNEENSNDGEQTRKEFVSRWNDKRDSSRKVGFGMSMRTLILVLVLLLICMYILEKKYI